MYYILGTSFDSHANTHTHWQTCKHTQRERYTFVEWKSSPRENERDGQRLRMGG